MDYGKSKDLEKRTQSDKVLREKAFEIASNLKYDGYQKVLSSIFYKFFDTKSAGSSVATLPSYQLAHDHHGQIIKNVRRTKVYSLFREGIWGVDFADIQSLCKFNKGIRYLLCAIVNAFQKIISKGRKSDKIWVDQRGEFYNYLFIMSLKNNNIGMYSTLMKKNLLFLKYLLEL